jgi:hypothetical protein
LNTYSWLEGVLSGRLKSVPERVGYTLAFVQDVLAEYDRATADHGDFNSAHEGWAVTFEELDELWEEVRKKRKNRDRHAMRHECVQIAACALKFAVSICRNKESK